MTKVPHQAGHAKLTTLFFALSLGAVEPRAGQLFNIYGRYLLHPSRFHQTFHSSSLVLDYVNTVQFQEEIHMCVLNECMMNKDADIPKNADGSQLFFLEVQ